MGAPYKHHAILQCLDVTHVNGGVPVFYSHESFGNADDWEHIPLLFAEPKDGAARLEADKNFEENFCMHTLNEYNFFYH